MARFVVTKSAIDDLDAIYNYIARDSVRYAQETIQDLMNTLETLSYTPAIGRAMRRDIRIFSHKAYLLFYTFDKTAEQIVLRRVIHTARDPKYREDKL